MDCPICKMPMETGEVQLRKSIANLFAFGLGSTELVFTNAASKAKSEIMNSWEFGKAYRCSSCGATLIATKP
jgi:hypothetical protein